MRMPTSIPVVRCPLLARAGLLAASKRPIRRTRVVRNPSRAGLEARVRKSRLTIRSLTVHVELLAHPGTRVRRLKPIRVTDPDQHAQLRNTMHVRWTITKSSRVTGVHSHVHMCVKMKKSYPCAQRDHALPNDGPRANQADQLDRHAS